MFIGEADLIERGGVHHDDGNSECASDFPAKKYFLKDIFEEHRRKPR